MGKALYRKYRSKSLGEIVGQEHITETLDKALKAGRIGHAYLFSGPRGTGKTSIARILAHEINGFPYTDDIAHLDIIEIDAASNRRIDEIRDLRDKVYIAPTSGKYKVYIIDEVHMLTREAFNALLKTLEEPPEHVVFILATTEAHKLPETIISRTQHFTFKPVEQQKVIDHLAYIAKQEKIKLTPGALELLAAHGEGSFRDSISLLDQAGSMGGTIDETMVRQLLGIAPDEAIESIITLVNQRQTAGAVIAELSGLYGQGLQAASIASQLAAKIRAGIVAGKPLLPVEVSLRMLRQLLEVPTSHNPERLLEIVLIESSGTPESVPVATISVAANPISTTPKPTSEPSQDSAPSTKGSKPSQSAVVEPDDTSTKKTGHVTAKSKPEQSLHPATPNEPATDAEVVVAATSSSQIRNLSASVWPEVLDGIKKQYNTLYGVLRMAQPIFTDDSIELQFKFAFHQKRLNEAKNRQIIADFIKQVTGKTIAVQCTINKDAVAGPVPAAAIATPASAPPDSITDIFGGGEVLHS
jgi:DNA polymerase III subunit gamma/tau